MRFCQLDEICELEPGRRIVAKRTLAAEERYLRDHFPRFPVMPGVMMLEALYQAAGWMLRTGDDFARPVILLKAAKSVKFADFLSPGETLEITASLVKAEGDLFTVKASGQKEGRTSVSGRLIIYYGEKPANARQTGPASEIIRQSRLDFERHFPSWQSQLATE